MHVRVLVEEVVDERRARAGKARDEDGPGGDALGDLGLPLEEPPHLHLDRE